MVSSNEKYRRSMLVKESGINPFEPLIPPPSHRGPEYLVAHACFKCSKSFKLSIESGKTKKNICPDCSGKIYEMGRNFKAPKKTDKKQWKKVKLLYSAGFRFFGSGMHDGPKLPEKLSDIERFIEENEKHPLRVAKPIVIIE